MRRCLSAAAPAVSAVAVGVAGTPSYRVFLASGGGRRVSPWHGLPLVPDAAAALSVVTFVCEIGRGSREKFEVASTEAHNPIKQDVKNGKLRLYHTPSIVNYGMLPRTWESNATARTYRGVNRPLYGDGDALDVLEIGTAGAHTGSVYPVRVLGALALIDEGEIDWKIIAIRASDAMAAEFAAEGFQSRALVERVDAAREWFRSYKVPDGKPPNEYAMGGEALPAGEAMDVVRGCHAEYGELLAGGGGTAAAKYWLRADE